MENHIMARIFTCILQIPNWSWASLSHILGSRGDCTRIQGRDISGDLSHVIQYSKSWLCVPFDIYLSSRLLWTYNERDIINMSPNLRDQSIIELINGTWFTFSYFKLLIKWLLHLGFLFRKSLSTCTAWLVDITFKYLSPFSLLTINFIISLLSFYCVQLRRTTLSLFCLAVSSTRILE